MGAFAATETEVVLSAHIPDDFIYFLAPQALRIKSLSMKPEKEGPLSNSEAWRLMMNMMLSPTTKTLHRPSWLHPFRRILWVDRHGPHRPTVEMVDVDFRSMGVIKGIA